MNSMPNPAQDTRPPGTVAELRAAAVIALQAWTVGSPEDAARLLQSWARRPEMTDDDVAVVLDVLFPDPDACPDWCIEDHREDDPRDDIVLHRGGDHTDSTVRRLLAATQLDIRIVSTTNVLPTEPGTAPTLNVRVDAELTTWEQAAELARTILDAFGYLGDLNHPAWRS